MINLYKSLILVSYTTYLAIIFMPAFNLYSEEALSILSWSNYGAAINLNPNTGYVFLVAYIVTLFGLLSFKFWARVAFVLLTILSIIATGVQGMLIYTPIDSILNYSTNLIDGALIAIMYLTSVSNKFSENS